MWRRESAENGRLLFTRWTLNWWWCRIGSIRIDLGTLGVAQRAIRVDYVRSGVRFIIIHTLAFVSVVIIDSCESITYVILTYGLAWFVFKFTNVLVSIKIEYSIPSCGCTP